MVYVDNILLLFLFYVKHSCPSHKAIKHALAVCKDSEIMLTCTIIAIVYQRVIRIPSRQFISKYYRHDNKKWSNLRNIDVSFLLNVIAAFTFLLGLKKVDRKSYEEPLARQIYLLSLCSIIPLHHHYNRYLICKRINNTVER